MCHPLGHEYPRSYRNLQQFAIHLSNAGFDTFRFDYYGTGNSAGKSDELTTRQCIKDIQAAAAYVREQSQCEKLSIIAVRIGAPLVMTTEIGEIENLIIWDPVMQGSNYISLLKDFHNRAISGLGRFMLMRKPSQVDQLYGHAMSPEKRQDLSDLNMPLGQKQKITQQLLLTSAGYLDNEAECKKLLPNWTHIPINDDIYWHSDRYTESAFSSPEAYHAMMSVLKGETK